MAFNLDGRMLASGSLDTTIRLWDVATRRSTATLEGHTDVVARVAFSPDGRMLTSGSLDTTIRLWDVATRRSTATLERRIRGIVAFNPDGRMLASNSWGNTIWLWAVPTDTSELQAAILGKWAGVFGPHSVIERNTGQPVYDYAFYADGTMGFFTIRETFGENATIEYFPATGRYAFQFYIGCEDRSPGL